MNEKAYHINPDAKKYEQIREEYRAMLPQDERISDRLEMTDMTLANQSYYLRTWAGFPVYRNTDLDYYSDPQAFLDVMQEALKQAQKFIFLECHILENSVVWSGIVGILLEKAAQGVDVRIIYDGVGSASLPHESLVEKLLEKQIKCKIFRQKTSPFAGVIRFRDYRKLLAIDGKAGFLGDYEFTNDGFNLVKENQEWKISGLSLKGDAVRNLTLSFLRLWNMTEEKAEDPIPFLLKTAYRAAESGFVQPFSTDPLSAEKAGKEAYLNMIRGARRYIYLTIPDKIRDQDLKMELLSAVKRGVRIYLIQLYENDKKSEKLERPEWEVTKQIRWFYYSAGRIQAREIVCDDQVAIVGNLHTDDEELKYFFENGCWFAGSRAVLTVKRDFEKMLPHCQEIS